MRSLLSLGLLFVVACTQATADSEKPTKEPEPTNPAPAAPAPDDTHGAPSTTYPAFTPSMPVLVNKGGKVLDKPVAITLTWDGDPDRATYEKLGDELGATPYWKSIVGEYGVGPITSGETNHVHLSEAIPFSDDKDVDPVDTIFEWVTAKLDGNAAGWPAPTDQSIYTLYFTGKTAQTLCDEGAGGLHDSIELKSGLEVAVALVFACEGDPTMNALESATVSASHELAEASVDPYPETHAGWQGLRAKDLDWELMQMVQDENADMCEFYDDVYGPAAAPALPFMVQRQWSNASAAAGHAPCVPALPGSYFNVAILEKKEAILADFKSLFGIPLSPHGEGFVLQMNQPKTISLGFVSDGPTEPIQVTAFEADAFDETGFTLIPADTSLLDVQVDRQTGQNGEKVVLSVTQKSALPHDVRLVVVKTKVGNTAHFMPLLVGAKSDPTPPTQNFGSTRPSGRRPASPDLSGPGSTSARQTHLRGGRAPAGKSLRASRISTPAIGGRLLPTLPSR